MRFTQEQMEIRMIEIGCALASDLRSSLAETIEAQGYGSLGGSNFVAQMCLAKLFAVYTRASAVTGISQICIGIIHFVWLIDKQFETKLFLLRLPTWQTGLHENQASLVLA